VLVADNYASLRLIPGPSWFRKSTLFCRKTWAQCNTDMIQCENNEDEDNVCVFKGCNGWFHIKCLKEKKIKCPSEGDKNPWYCPPCVVARSLL